MQCETTGVFRAYLDGELDAAASSRLEQHLTACPRCQLRLEQVRANAEAVANRFRSLEPSTETVQARQMQAWARLQSGRYPERVASSGEQEVARHSSIHSPGALRTRVHQLGGLLMTIANAFSVRQRAAIALALVAVLLAGVMMVPAGRAAAVGFLNLFRVQRFVAVSIDPNQPFNAFAYLNRIGKVTLPQSRPAQGSITTAPLDELGAKAGIKIRQPGALPAGVAGKPLVHAVPAAEASFTLDRQKAEAYLKSAGAANTSVPAKYDGARLVVKVPMAVLMTYGDKDGLPQLVVGQLASPTAGAEGGATLGELREFLLSLPGLPADTVAQLRAIDDWTQTLPIPVPRDRAVWHDVSIDGTPALAVADPSAGAQGLIWQRDGIVYGVAGLFSERQLMDVARSLK